MNKLIIIGNLTKDPEQRTTPSGKTVCNFDVAVNRRNNETDFFRVAAWNELGNNCQKYLEKGKKVCVVGSVTARPYINQKNEACASLEVTANEVEFLSPKNGGTIQTENQNYGGMIPVDVDDNPF